MRNNNYIIEVYDNLFNHTILDALSNFAENLNWNFGDRYTDDDPFSLQFWGCPIMSNSKLFIDNPSSLPNHINECDKLIYDVWDIIKQQHKISELNLSIDTIIVNGQSFGQEGGIHIDHGSEDENNSGGRFTVVLYLNRNWHPSWQGETMFYNNSGTDIIKAVVPHPGRVLFFDARIPHQARPPHRSIDDLRMTMAFHLIT
jgi:hypothetical protein